MESDSSVQVSILAQLIRYLESRHIDLEEILKKTNIDKSILQQPEMRIPAWQYAEFYRLAFDFADDPFFGLHLGEFVELNTFSVLGYMIMNCRTLNEAILEIEKYEKILGRIPRIHQILSSGDLKAVYKQESESESFDRHQIESIFSSVICFLRKIGMRDICPLEIGFFHHSPQVISEYTRVFSCPVRFGQNENYYIIAKKDLEFEFPDSNPMLFNHFTRYIENVSADLERSNTYSSRIKEMIVNNVNKHLFSLPDIARKLGLGTRTLQLKLKQEGVTFRKLLEDIRRDLAIHCLKNGNSVDETAYLLGYSDASAFCHAFRSWTGGTPADFRL